MNNPYSLNNLYKSLIESLKENLLLSNEDLISIFNNIYIAKDESLMEKIKETSSLNLAIDAFALQKYLSDTINRISSQEITENPQKNIFNPIYIHLQEPEFSESELNLKNELFEIYSRNNSSYSRYLFESEVSVAVKTLIIKPINEALHNHIIKFIKNQLDYIIEENKKSLFIPKESIKNSFILYSQYLEFSHIYNKRINLNDAQSLSEDIFKYANKIKNLFQEPWKDTLLLKPIRSTPIFSENIQSFLIEYYKDCAEAHFIYELENLLDLDGRESTYTLIEKNKDNLSFQNLCKDIRNNVKHNYFSNLTNIGKDLFSDKHNFELLKECLDIKTEDLIYLKDGKVTISSNIKKYSFNTEALFILDQAFHNNKEFFQSIIFNNFFTLKEYPIDFISSPNININPDDLKNIIIDFFDEINLQQTSFQQTTPLTENNDFLSMSESFRNKIKKVNLAKKFIEQDNIKEHKQKHKI